MFFHMDSIKEFKKSIQSWRFVTIAIIIIGVRGVGDSKAEKQLLIAMGKVNLTKTFSILEIISKHNMNNFLRCTMEAIVESF